MRVGRPGAWRPEDMELSTAEQKQVERHSIRRARLPQFPEKDNSSTTKVSESGHEVTGNTLDRWAILSLIPDFSGIQ